MSIKSYIDLSKYYSYIIYVKISLKLRCKYMYILMVLNEFQFLPCYYHTNVAEIFVAILASMIMVNVYKFKEGILQVLRQNCLNRRFTCNIR